jgi:ACS family tartrate transporter-like MFS transporter
VEEATVDANVPITAKVPITLTEIEPIERETIKRVTWRLMPLLMLGYFCAYLDRSNVGMAATTMIKDLGFTNAVFGFGAGLFFFGYFLAEIPSNLILNKVGARIWIARILITWGIVAALTGIVRNEWSFYSIRFLLGLAEAGFYPGIVLYLTWWFPSYYRTRMMGIFQSASVISLFIGPPIGGLLLHLNGFLGLAGWRWLYILEGVPPIIMCFVFYKLLTGRKAPTGSRLNKGTGWSTGWPPRRRSARPSASIRSARRSPTRRSGCARWPMSARIFLRTRWCFSCH